MANREQLLAIKALMDKGASAAQAQSLIAKGGSAANMGGTEAQQRVTNLQQAQSDAPQTVIHGSTSGRTMGQIDPATAMKSKTIGQIDPATAVKTTPTQTPTVGGMAYTGAESTTTTPQPTTSPMAGLGGEGLQDFFASLGQTPAQQEAQKALQALLSQPTATPEGLTELQQQRADIAAGQAALARQIQSQEQMIRGVGKQLGAEGGELTNIARQRIEEARTAPLREQLTSFITQKEEFGQTIADIDKSIDRSLDFARQQRQDEITRLQQFIDASGFSPNQQTFLNEMIKQKSKELFDKDEQDARLLKSAMRTRDISQLPEDLQVDFVSNAVNDVLNQPAYKGIATLERTPGKIVSDIIRRIQSGETLDEAIQRDLVEPLNKKPEVMQARQYEAAKTERQQQLVSKGTATGGGAKKAEGKYTSIESANPFTEGPARQGEQWKVTRDAEGNPLSATRVESTATTPRIQITGETK